MSKDTARQPLRLPTRKTAPSPAKPRPLSHYADSANLYKNRGIPREYVDVRIARDRQAAAMGFYQDKQSFKRALNWNDRHLLGNEADYRKFLFVRGRDSKGVPNEFESYSALQDMYREEVLDHLGDLTDNPLILEHLPGIEESQLSKWGPKSRYKPYYDSDLSKRVDEVMSEDGPLHLNMNAVNKTVDFMKKMVGKDFIPMASLMEVWNTIPQEGDEGDINAPSLDSTTNSGPPWYVRQWRDLSGEDPYRTMTGKDILSVAKYFHRHLMNGTPVPLRAIMAHRLTSGGPGDWDTKERPVIAMEKADAVVGKCVTYYLLSALRLKRFGLMGDTGASFIAWNDAPFLDIEMQRILNYAKSTEDVVINSSDVSAFDSSTNSDLIMLAGEIVGYWMKGGQKFVRALTESMACHTSLLTPLKVYPATRGGVKSGDGLTNLVDTIISLFVFIYGHFVGAYELHTFYAQGDDGIQVGRGITPENISDIYKECGFDANPSKQWQAPGTVQYLQKLFVLDYKGGIFPTARSAGSALTYERMKYREGEWSPEAQTVSIISSLENAAFNPLFDRMVEFIASGDRYHLHSSVGRASKILERAGQTGLELLTTSKEATVNKQVSDELVNGFDLGITNGVLRGESFPAKGSDAYWQRVYREARIENTQKEITLEE